MDNKEQKNPADFIGQPIHVGDYVVGAQSTSLAMYKVIKITPKMIRIVSINAKTRLALKGKLRYADELLKVEERLVTFHLMKS